MDNNQGRFNWIIIVIGFLVVLGVVLGVSEGIAAVVSVNKENHIYTSDNGGIIGALSAVEVGATPTGFAAVVLETTPTVTDTVTPSPTFISDSRTNTPAIRYETRVQEVTAIVTVIHTSVPDPTSTPVPTFDKQATQFAIYVANQEIAIKAKERSGMWEWLAIIAVGIVGLMLWTVLVYVLMRDLWVWATKPRNKVEQSAEEILQPMSPVDGVTVAELEEIRLMTAQGKSQRMIEWNISGRRGKPYTGGIIHQQVKEALEYLEGEG